MNAKNLSKHYDRLTPEERFCLILAAGARRDTVEQDRLSHTSQRISLTMRDYTPWSYAFNELAMLNFLELMEAAAKQRETFHRWVEETNGGEELPDDEASEAVEVNEGEAGSVADGPENVRQRAIADRLLSLCLAEGFVLKTKAQGWKEFCDKLSVPPFAIWQTLCGFERLEQALDWVEGNDARPGAAFLPEGMLRFLGEIRSPDQPEPSMSGLISPERYAAELNTLFHERVSWWGGE